jgi:hypothetical protein
LSPCRSPLPSLPVDASHLDSFRSSQGFRVENSRPKLRNYSSPASRQFPNCATRPLRTAISCWRLRPPSSASIQGSTQWSQCSGVLLRPALVAHVEIDTRTIQTEIVGCGPGFGEGPQRHFRWIAAIAVHLMGNGHSFDEGPQTGSLQESGSRWSFGIWCLLEIDLRDLLCWWTDFVSSLKHGHILVSSACICKPREMIQSQNL